jgi:hypothetical protein
MSLTRIVFKELHMKNKFFFGVVIFFLFSLFAFFCGLVGPRFIGVVARPAGVVAVKNVDQPSVVAVVRVVDANVVVNVVEDVLV